MQHNKLNIESHKYTLIGAGLIIAIIIVASGLLVSL